MDFEKSFHDQLAQLKAEGNYRIFAELERKRGDYPRAASHAHGAVSAVTVWCSNDYLGMGQNPDVVAAMVETAQACGTGAGGTRNISGNHHHHVKLEAELADLHGKEGALLFTSGYVSNWAALSTLGSAPSTRSSYRILMAGSIVDDVVIGGHAADLGLHL